MAKKLQILRGTTAQNDAYTGSVGELTMDTEKVEIRIHDGITLGGKTIGSGGGASLPILTRMWSDYVINDMSWLRADTFSWQSGDTYKSAYEHLADDLGEVEILYCWGGDVFTKTPTPNIDDRLYRADGTDWGAHVDYTDNDHSYIISSDGVAQLSRDESGDLQLPKEKSPQTDTIGEITITYYLADDGHKICLPDQESNLSALYEATGVAWYYLLDTENKQFKLPRTNNLFKHYVPDYSQSKTISSGWVAEYDCVCFLCNSWENSVDFKVDGKQVHRFEGSGGYGHPTGAWFMIPKGGTVTYSGGFTVSPTVYPMKSVSELDEIAGEKYLYFYVGNFEQTAVEQTAGLNAEMFNGKADRNLLNTTDNVDIVVETQLPTADNGYTWYRKYKSGWVEQGGVVAVSTAGAATNVTFPIEMKDINYSALGNRVVRATSGTGYQASVAFSVYQTTGMKLHCGVGSNAQVAWQVSGKAA